jgi:putative NADH-flavin reductase
VQVRFFGGTSECTIRHPVGVTARILVIGGASKLAFDDQRISATRDETRLQSPDYDVEEKLRAKSSLNALEKISPFRGCATPPVM